MAIRSPQATHCVMKGTLQCADVRGVRATANRLRAVIEISLVLGVSTIAAQAHGVLTPHISDNSANG
ncbi:hypothetical protein BC834DRAFT_974655 [Gloeopeniophorella convolvens]|nr:hypothetical protein BC834DRAFT_974655 [Gloeopeniophorella convolvens]